MLLANHPRSFTVLGMPANDPVSSGYPAKVAIIGGAGRVGLPLGVLLARAGLEVTLVDIDDQRVQLITDGNSPFHEDGLAGPLLEVVTSGRLRATTDPTHVAEVGTVVICVDTPVEALVDHSRDNVLGAVQGLMASLRDGQLLLLRSTSRPGTADNVRRLLLESGLDLTVAAVPERIAEGRSMEELPNLPQLVGAFDDDGYALAQDLFAQIGVNCVRLTPTEAEYAKLLTNTWRYVTFAVANEFNALLEDDGLSFTRIREAARSGYPRLASLPSAGFSSGPCLEKDTRALLTMFPSSRFAAASLDVHRSMISHVIGLLEGPRGDRSALTPGDSVAVLGVTFKPGSDDHRSSLSLTLIDALRERGYRVLWSDPHARLPGGLTLTEALDSCDIAVVATPHPEYVELLDHPGVVFPFGWAR